MGGAADLRTLASPALRRALLQARFRARALTSPARPLPDFLVIGGMRCGTSSLFKYLSAHPDVVRPLRKEVGYLTLHHDQPLAWYRTHFPLRARSGRRRTFEATPHYLFHPLAPARAARLLPQARLVVVLRDPVERAISHYELQVRTGAERLDFTAAIAAEPARLAGEVERLRADPAYPAAALHHYSYVARGRYAEQLAAWLRHFPRERLHVVRSEDLFAEPAATYRGILSFLGLSEWLPARFPNYSDSPGSRPDRRAERALLAGVFSEANARLAELAGRDFGWDG